MKENNFWTVLTKSGKTITKTANEDWLKYNTDVLVITTLPAIKTIIIHD